MRARTTLAATAAVLAAAVTACATTTQPGAAGSHTVGVVQAPPSKPNIIFVLTDDLDPSLVQYMPHVVRMEKQGTSFRNFFVTDSLCCPSRASILRGQFPHNTGIYVNVAPNGGFTAFHAKGEDQSTIGTWLQSAGYRTGFMGKFLNRYLEPDSGVADTYVPPGWNEWDVADNKGYSEFGYRMNTNGRVVTYGTGAGSYLTDVIASKGAAFISSAAHGAQPFFLELATYAPHAPYVPAPRNAQDFPGLRAPRPPSFNEADISDKPTWLRGHALLSATAIANLDRAYRLRAQSVEAVDALIGTVEQALRNSGQTRDTYLVFSSDNGYHLGEHRLHAGKLTAYDTDIHVPLVVTGPGVPAGQTLSQPAMNVDLAPTFAAIAGASTPAVDGRSLLPLLQGQTTPDWRDAVLVEHGGSSSGSDPDATPWPENPPDYVALRTPGYLYVEYADGDREYYDEQADPYELDNLAGQLSGTRLASLHAAVTAYRSCQGGGCWVAGHVPNS